MKVLSFSYCFPSSLRPTWGVFVLQRLAALARLTDLEVVSPVPVFPLWTRFHSGLPARKDEISGLAVHRPRYFYVPGFLKPLDGKWYARGLKHWLAEYCRRRRPDLLDAHFVWPDGVGVYHLSRWLGVPCIITERGWLYECLKRRSIRRQCAEALRHAAAVITVSRPLAELAADLGVEPDRLHVIPNGVDMQRFCPRDKAESRRELGVPTDGRLLVTVAHLGPRKGHRETIQALAALPEDVRLVIVGSDSQGGGRNERALRGLIDRLGLGHRVLLAGGQPYERIPRYFAAADASVLASYREGCPNVVLESLACGTPVVATGVGAVADMIKPGENGTLVPPRQVEPLAEAIQSLLDRPPSPQQVRGSPAVRSWDDVAAAVCEVLRQAAVPIGAGSGREGKPQASAKACKTPVTAGRFPGEA